jgi:hypothetical protein
MDDRYRDGQVRVRRGSGSVRERRTERVRLPPAALSGPAADTVTSAGLKPWRSPFDSDRDHRGRLAKRRRHQDDTLAIDGSSPSASTTPVRAGGPDDSYEVVIGVRLPAPVRLPVNSAGRGERPDKTREVRSIRTTGTPCRCRPMVGSGPLPRPVRVRFLSPAPPLNYATTPRRSKLCSRSPSSSTTGRPRSTPTSASGRRSAPSSRRTVP